MYIYKYSKKGYLLIPYRTYTQKLDFFKKNYEIFKKKTPCRKNWKFLKNIAICISNERVCKMQFIGAFRFGKFLILDELWPN